MKTETLLAERRKADRIPRGMRVVVQLLATGQRLMIDRQGRVFLQSVGEDADPIAFADILTNHEGQESEPGLRDYLEPRERAASGRYGRGWARGGRGGMGRVGRTTSALIKFLYP
jgi:hypothetical protein